MTWRRILPRNIHASFPRSERPYEPGAKFSTWLFTIAGNVARNAARSLGRRKEVSEVDAPRGDDSLAALNCWRLPLLNQVA